MAIQTREVALQAGDGTELQAQMAWDDDIDGRRPCVLVAHDVWGLHPGPLYRERAHALAEMGYVGFAMDVYGTAERSGTTEEAMALMNRLTEDRPLLHDRLLANVAAAGEQAEVSVAEVAAIGYCFGGLCVLELARINAPLRGVASFHGLLSATQTDAAATESIAPKVLVMHGWDDPLVPPEQVVDFCAEMTAAEADWQLISYGHTKHSFTNPKAGDMGAPDFAAYSPASRRRSWHSLEAFLDELFEV